VPNGLRTGDEQRDGLVAAQRLGLSRVLSTRHAKSGHGELVLAGEPQRRAARRDHLEPGSRREQLAHDRRRVVHSLEVVEQEQQRLVTQRILDAVDRRAVHLAGRNGMGNRR
jgi:hypothetical protein